MNALSAFLIVCQTELGIDQDTDVFHITLQSGRKDQ